MTKTTWKAGTMIYPLPAVMVTSGTMEKPNVFTAAWTGVINSEPAMTYVSIRPSRYSHELIEQNGEFVINLTTQDLLHAADFCGVKSGRDTDKFAETGMTPMPCKFVKAPQIAQSPVSVECKVTEIKKLGSHDMFIAEILAVDVDDSLLDDAGKLALEKCGLVAFCHGGYYGLGEQIGTFGFSVAKKKSRKQKIHEIKAKRRLEKAAHAAEEAEEEEETFKKRKPAFEHRERRNFEDRRRTDREPRKFDRDDRRYADRKPRKFDRDERAFDNDEKPFKKPFAKKPFGNGKKDFGDRKPFGKTFEGKKPFAGKKPARKPFKPKAQ